MRTTLKVFSALSLLCSVAAQAQEVLVYDDNSEDNVAATACTNLGYTCTVTGDSDFTSSLQGGGWDAVVMDFPSNPPLGDWQTAVSDYIVGGGRVIMTGWEESFILSKALHLMPAKGIYEAAALYTILLDV